MRFPDNSTADGELRLVTNIHTSCLFLLPLFFYSSFLEISLLLWWPHLGIQPALLTTGLGRHTRVDHGINYWLGGARHLVAAPVDLLEKLGQAQRSQ